MMIKTVNKVAGYRAATGMSQKGMAKYLGMLPQTYSNKERGITSFKDSEKIKMKEFLLQYFPEITIQDIFF